MAVSTPKLPRARIAGRRDYTDDLFGLWLEPEIDFRFTAGQYVTIGAHGIERPYSIVSAPSEPRLELFVERVAGGGLTPVLHQLDVGDTVTMRPRAKGRFTLRAQATHHVMIATVTGVAPYVSILREHFRRRLARDAPHDALRFFVLLGASHRDELVYDDELRRHGDAHPDAVRFVGSVSRPHAPRNAGWTGPVGRINLLVDRCLERWQPPQPDTVIYTCGHPGMIADVRDRLAPQGWTLVEEQYW